MSDPINLIAEWLRGLLASWGLASGLIMFIMTLLGVLAVAIFVLVMDIFLVWVERKVVARFQDRLGPNRLGPFGLIQPFADVIKLLIKEDITPDGADRVVYNHRTHPGAGNRPDPLGSHPVFFDHAGR